MFNSSIARATAFSAERAGRYSDFKRHTVHRGLDRTTSRATFAPVAAAGCLLPRRRSAKIVSWFICLRYNVSFGLTVWRHIDGRNGDRP
jgi:hypothetical protein